MMVFNRLEFDFLGWQQVVGLRLLRGRLLEDGLRHIILVSVPVNLSAQGVVAGADVVIQDQIVDRRRLLGQVPDPVNPWSLDRDQIL